MSRWGPALIVCGGLAATAGAWYALDLVYACVAALGTLTYAAFASPVIGSTAVPPGSTPDPTEVRRWREQHPGSTVSEAIAAVSAR